MHLVPRSEGSIYIAMGLGVQDPKALHLSLERFHTILVHAAEPAARDTSRRLGIQLCGQLDKCDACSIAKVHVKPLLERIFQINLPNLVSCCGLTHFPCKPPEVEGRKFGSWR